jgi:RNA polymerase sigma-70 factor (ECF subfamily)
MAYLSFNGMDKLLQIVDGCYRQHRQSQQALYERYYGYSLKIAFRYMDSYEEAVQLTNAAFLTIFLNFNRFKLVDKSKVVFYLTGWIKKEMIGAIVQDLKPKINLHQPDRLPKTFRRDQHPLFPETPELYAELIATSRELPPGFRTVFNLHVIDRYPQTEIGKMLGISLETTVSYLQIARQHCIKPLLTPKSPTGESCRRPQP